MLIEPLLCRDHCFKERTTTKRCNPCSQKANNLNLEKIFERKLAIHGRNVKVLLVE